ncbi:hypothetical protein AR543_01920 [Paenibacillus bovis]|uniref:Uncharacterized protein n=1 Tax=Paenibacillus bovis TaxID=1616788 RepID=A0A172ZLQ8_9BACL|nr:hypothetical protein AR543_01920 [Paenibacillus bovis]
MLSQDHRIPSYAYPAISRTEGLKQLEQAREKDQSLLQFYVENSQDYLDWMDRPICMVSDQMKSLMAVYENEIKWITAILADIQQMTQKIYWIPEFPQLSALSKQSIWAKNGTLQKIILDEDVVEEYKIFRLADSATHELIVDLDVAECLLKFNLKGFYLTEVSTVCKMEQEIILE